MQGSPLHQNRHGVAIQVRNGSHVCFQGDCYSLSLTAFCDNELSSSSLEAEILERQFVLDQLENLQRLQQAPPSTNAPFSSERMYEMQVVGKCLQGRQAKL